ncbi:SPOR domain-containing protein [Neobacillus citreus]|uniref:SPOR domain-containing protein n=1 Tax=Neobacillus citreus TaxID=2833578 RepID=A0A942T2E4_9BACI|nr:SPOR domain-containing protein [Neobacillus citreus]MCH6266696.1 SPOR domain-containing protein [Neobacillus citreus]
MDKPKKGHTITIKLNGETKSFREEPRKNVPEPKPEPIPNEIKIDSELQESEGINEAAAAQESIEESFDWIIPESSENDVEEFTIVNSQNIKNSRPKKSSISFASFSNKNNRRPIGSIVITAVCAILIGLTIGFFMLKLVITESGEKPVTEPNVAGETGNEKEQTETTDKTAATSIEQLSTYVVQGGVFTSKAGAEDTAKQLKSRGIPSEQVEIGGKFYLFLSVADSLETAKSISTKYKDKGAEGAFAKPLMLDEKKLSNLTDNEKSFIESLPSIYQSLSTMVSGALVSSSVSADAGISEKLKINNIKNDSINKMKTELMGADEKVKAFQKSKDTKSLVDAEQHLLNFLSIYNSL